jgi:hypothetical protein
MRLSHTNSYAILMNENNTHLLSRLPQTNARLTRLTSHHSSTTIYLHPSQRPYASTSEPRPTLHASRPTSSDLLRTPLSPPYPATDTSIYHMTAPSSVHQGAHALRHSLENLAPTSSHVTQTASTIAATPPPDRILRKNRRRGPTELGSVPRLADNFDKGRRENRSPGSRIWIGHQLEKGRLLASQEQAGEALEAFTFVRHAFSRYRGCPSCC